MKFVIIGIGQFGRALALYLTQSGFEVTIIAVGESFERSLLIAAQIKEIGGVKHLYARSVNEMQGKVLKLIGVSELFRVEDVAAKQLATRFINEGLMRLRKIDTTHSLAEVNLPEAWVGKSLMEVELRSRYHLNLLTVRRGKPTETAETDDVILQPEQPVIDTPEPSMKFQQGDVLVLFGKDSDLQNFVDYFAL